MEGNSGFSFGKKVLRVVVVGFSFGFRKGVGVVFASFDLDAPKKT